MFYSLKKYFKVVPSGSVKIKLISWNYTIKINTVISCIVSVEKIGLNFATLYFYLMNALVHVDIDQGIHKVKIKSYSK